MINNTGLARSLEQVRLEMTVLENLKRIHTLLKRIAREFVPREIRE